MESVATPRASVPKVVVAATLGSVMEYFDFFASITAAALVWPSVFFPAGNPVTALALSLSTYGLAFLVRPVGAIIFGHLGDTRGRKSTLVWTLSTMAMGTLGIGLLPGFATVGAAAPVLLVLFRLLQGIGLGGEWGSASTWLAEFAAASRWRTFWTSWIQGSAGYGILLASFTFTVVASFTSHQYLLDFGWRVVYFIGVLILGVGAVIRYRLQESPMFTRLQEEKRTERSPVTTVFRENWRKIILLAFAATFVITLGEIEDVPFSLIYTVKLGFPFAFATGVSTLASLFSLPIPILAAIVASRYVRKKKWMLALGLAITMAVAFPFFMLISTKQPALIVLAHLLWQAGMGVGGCVVPALITEQFATRYRNSGAGLSYQIGAGIIPGMFATFVVPSIIAFAHGPLGAWPYIAATTIAMGAVCLAAVLSIKEPDSVELAA